MSQGRFTTFGSTWVFDQGVAALLRQKAEDERQQRAETWVAEKFAGRTFHSFEALVTCARSLLEQTIGGAMPEEHLRVLTNACRALFGGLSQTGGRAQIKIGVDGRPEYVSFIQAA